MEFDDLEFVSILRVEFVDILLGLFSCIEGFEVEEFPVFALEVRMVDAIGVPGWHSLFIFHAFRLALPTCLGFSRNNRTTQGKQSGSPSLQSLKSHL